RVPVASRSAVCAGRPDEPTCKTSGASASEGARAVLLSLNRPPSSHHYPHMHHYSRIPFLLLIIGLLASLWTAARRVAVERMARTVELTVDMEQLRQLTLDLGVPLPDALERLKHAGVTSIALGEESLGELETDG